MNYWNREKRKNKQTVDDPSPSRRLGKSNGAKLYIHVKHKIIIERYELDKWIRLTLLAVQWGWVILEMTFAAKQDSASKATKGPPIYIYIITGVQASGVILDRLFRQCCFVWSEIVGPHSSRSFNDNECGPTISHHTIKHCRNKRMKPEILWLLIVKALQLKELSDLRNTFHPEVKYSYIYIWYSSHVLMWADSFGWKLCRDSAPLAVYLPIRRIGRRVTGCQFFLYGSSSVFYCLYTNITTKIELYDFYRHTVCQCNTGYRPSLIMVMISRGTFITRGGHIVSRSDIYRPSSPVSPTN